MDDQFMPTSIWEADRIAVETALLAPGSKARNQRGALAVSKLKTIGQRVWSANHGDGTDRTFVPESCGLHN